MAEVGWKKLVANWPWFQREGDCPIEPPTEFLGPVRVLRKPYGAWDPVALDDEDPYGWPVTEYEEALALRSGMHDIGRILLDKIVRLANGESIDEFAPDQLRDNPFWPAKDKPPEHERFVLLMPLALSQTTDEKGRVTWTVYGGSEQGPSRPFWRGFYSAPKVERPADEGLGFLRRLIEILGQDEVGDLRGAGFRILPQGNVSDLGLPAEGPLPSWTSPLIHRETDSLAGVKFLLTFRPYRRLPTAVRAKYRAGKLHLLPFPASLVVWGVPDYLKLQQTMPLAMQIPLLHLLEQQRGIDGLRVPASGWFEEPVEGEAPPAAGERGPLREKVRRSHRREYIQRDVDDLSEAREHWLVDALFSTDPKHIGLYEKPLARNAQLWSHDFELLLDGPRANGKQIRRVGDRVERGGVYGYRMTNPAMTVGKHEVYWHRPLVAYRTPAGKSVTLHDGPLGYMTAYDVKRPNIAKPIELWPRLLQREMHADNVALFLEGHTDERQETLLNVRKLLDESEQHGAPLPRALAECLLRLGRRETLDSWLRQLSKRSRDPEAARPFVAKLEALLEANSPKAPASPPSLTYSRTATREFEVAYWNAIADLSTGEFANTNNADCVLDPVSEAALKHHRRDLEPLGEYLLARHMRSIKDAGMTGSAVVGELPFHWGGDYAWEWMGGWKDNQSGRTHERNLLVVIPGRDRSRAVVLADHYDTAYMEDHYDPEEGGWGARVAAPGADDNCSASAALLLAAPVFLDLSRHGKLGCDVWLLHLTGEEYPAAGLGAWDFIRRIVEGTLRMHLPSGRPRDLSSTRVQGLYVMDMIAHNTRRDPDVFQIAPGSGHEAWWCAWHMHEATRIWNDSVAKWNQARRGAKRGQRRRSGRVPPEIALHPTLRGEVRVEYDPRSTLYNTDGQAFSDAGVPVVLLMENYDLLRRGYHDQHDTLENIDLDYGAALAAIAIESVARAAQ